MRVRYPNSMTALITKSSETVKYIIEESQLNPKMFIMAESTKSVFGRPFEYYIFVHGASDISNNEICDIVDYLKLHGAKEITDRFYIDEREWFASTKEQLLKKFPEDFSELMTQSPLANKIFMVLLNGGDPYEMISHAIKQNLDQQNIMSQLIEQLPPKPIKIE